MTMPNPPKDGDGMPVGGTTMFKFLTRTKVLWWLMPFALLATGNSNAEPMTFSYTFVGRPTQPFSAGAVLTGTIDGTGTRPCAIRLSIV